MCRLTAISKVPRACELIDGLIEEGEKVIVFSTYHDPMDLLEDHYRGRCVRIDGSVNSLTRDKHVQRFIGDDHCKVFIGQNSAAGVGINLVNSSNVVFMDMPITPDNLEQPYKRAHRIGQTKQVNVYYTIAKNTIDERVYDLIKDKLDDIIEIFDKGKKGVIHYEDLEEKLIKDLIG